MRKDADGVENRGANSYPGPERRRLRRFPMDFEVEVATFQTSGKKHQEKAVLKDISCEGARFIVPQPPHYVPGQYLEVTIHLPGTREVKAKMRAKAKVLRVGQSGKRLSEAGDRETGVVVKFETPLCFERDPVEVERSDDMGKQN